MTGHTIPDQPDRAGDGFSLVLPGVPPSMTLGDERPAAPPPGSAEVLETPLTPEIVEMISEMDFPCLCGTYPVRMGSSHGGSLEIRRVRIHKACRPDPWPANPRYAALDVLLEAWGGICPSSCPECGHPVRRGEPAWLGWRTFYIGCGRSIDPSSLASWMWRDGTVQRRR